MNPNYPNYGGRGISVCREWRDSFECFLLCVGARPTSKHSIDRFPNNDGNYEPGNVRWATKTEQDRNVRRNRWIEWDGRKMIVADWAKELRMSPNGLLKRLNNHPLEIAMNPGGNNAPRHRVKPLPTHCRRGHEFTDVNTRWIPQPNGKRTRACYQCYIENRRTVKKKRRELVFRDRKYLDWLRDECRCVVCVILKMCYRDRRCASGSMPIDPAHGPENGRGSKGPDNEAISLCRFHHIEQHQIGWNLFEAKYGFSRAAEAKAHYAAYLLTRS